MSFNPFDEAWELVKAPLDYDSIKDVSIPGKGKRSMAYFDDPTTGKRYPMVNYGGSNIIVYDPNFANPSGEVDLNTYFDPWEANNINEMAVGEADYALRVNRMSWALMKNIKEEELQLLCMIFLLKA